MNFHEFMFFEAGRVYSIQDALNEKRLNIQMVWIEGLITLVVNFLNKSKNTQFGRQAQCRTSKHGNMYMIGFF